MKLLIVHTESLAGLRDHYFLPSLKDDFELITHEYDIQGTGRYMEPDWSEAVAFKSRMIIQTIKENPGEIFLYSDVDIRFYAPVQEVVLECMKDLDILGHIDDCMGNLCTGFLAMRANARTLRLWEEILRAIPFNRCDQPYFNRLLWCMSDIRWGFLPVTFFGGGTFSARQWKPDATFYIPQNPHLFHANWTIGVENKIKLLQQADQIIGLGSHAIDHNNKTVLQDRALAGQIRETRTQVAHAHHRHAQLHKTFEEPRQLRIDVSSVCQLKCPTCPTSNGTIARTFGAGLLKVEDFKSFIDRHPNLSTIELSNWGEVFLNPGFLQILEIAHERHIHLTVGNGANLNYASETVLEGLVKYQLRYLTCSIDGASQETYSIYRIRGDFERVMRHIRTINRYKDAYQSDYPILRWQFVAFGHNEHEITKARSMADTLGMEFYLKLSWDDLYGSAFSPVVDKAMIRRKTGTGVADRAEYEARYGKSFLQDTCHQMWKSPQIHHDGKLLGCCVNHYGDYGNVFQNGLRDCLTSDKMTYARNMLLGIAEAKEDIPCTRCKVYELRRNLNDWVDLRNLSDY